jgi:hypothetical protein
VGNEAAAIRELKRAAERRDQVERETERARARAGAELAAAIKRAQREGVTVTRIARELGVSRQRVHQLRERG